MKEVQAVFSISRIFFQWLWAQANSGSSKCELIKIYVPLIENAVYVLITEITIYDKTQHDPLKLTYTNILCDNTVNC